MVQTWQAQCTRAVLFAAIAGLVAITPAAGYCTPIIAVLIGLIAGSVCFWLSELKYRLNYDDALDAFGLHGISGIIGALLTGVCCRQRPPLVNTIRYSGT